MFLYGGWPFLTGLVSELRDGAPGMMTLIALAVAVAYGYSAAVVLGLEGKVFFWELATLVDVMLLGHWIEMRSVMGASGALESMVTVMVITCPHALGLAVPLVVAVSTGLAAGRGLLIRDRAGFERARKLDAIVFDKTGTLTAGRFGVKQVAGFGDIGEDDLLRLAAGLESYSEHPIANGIVETARDTGIEIPEATDFENLSGRGAKARVDGRTIRVVSPGYLREQDIAVDEDRVAPLREGGNTLVYVLDGERPIGAIALADMIRDESREAIARLKAMGIDCLMLTGDAEAVAKAVAKELGLDEFFAEVLPDEKAARIEDVQRRGRTVAMVGDGVNDAPALVKSDLGIAIGAGTDVAVESADVVLVESDPRSVADVIRLSRATYGKMIQNLFWATGYNAVAIPLAAGVAYGAGILLSPAVGATLMSLSTVIVAINAKLLSRFEPSAA